jgi:hypothetical protein
VVATLAGLTAGPAGHPVLADGARAARCRADAAHARRAVGRCDRFDTLAPRAVTGGNASDCVIVAPPERGRPVDCSPFVTAGAPGGRFVAVLLSASGRARALACALGLSLASGGCSEAIEPRTDPEGEQLRLGRIHVVLEPTEDVIAPEPPSTDTVDAALEVTARFAFVRGLEEEFVRARIDVPVLPHDALRASECVPTDSLVLDSGEPEETSDVRELVLVDAGDLTVRVGDTDFDVPLSLVPDLLPYMSGVEYLQEGDNVPLVAGATPRVLVQAKGSMTEDLPPFTTEGVVPPALGLVASEADLEEQREGALVLRWNADDDANGPDITVRLLPLVNGEPVGDEITCVLADHGSARIDMTRLAVLGLPPQAEALRVTASRVAVSTFDVGDFAGSELVIERRDRLYVPLAIRR